MTPQFKLIWSVNVSVFVLVTGAAGEHRWTDTGSLQVWLLSHLWCISWSCYINMRDWLMDKTANSLPVVQPSGLFTCVVVLDPHSCHEDIQTFICKMSLLIEPVSDEKCFSLEVSLKNLKKSSCFVVIFTKLHNRQLVVFYSNK